MLLLYEKKFEITGSLRDFMRVIHVASELTPIAKVGGLGDVLMGLTRGLSSKGHDIVTLIPFYGFIDREHLAPELKIDWFDTEFDGVKRRAFVRYYRLQEDLTVGLVDTENGYFRNHFSIYGNQDGVAGFLFFCRAVADWLLTSHRPFDILHVHDWPTALLPSIYQIVSGGKVSCKSVLTVHNFEYQGRCDWRDLARVGIHSHHFADPSVLQDPGYSCLNLVKAGLLTVDRATTVSPTYAREMLSQEHSFGLHDVLSGLGEKFVGILNGIDYSYWNPKTDVFLSTRYADSDGIPAVRAAKRENRARLFSDIGIPVMPNIPLIASVTRLVKQKGIYLMKELFSQAEPLDFQCLVLGSVPEAGAIDSFLSLDAQLRAQGRGAVFLMSDESLAHRTYAASDIFVVPSVFEPCGLTQLISLKYGTIPIVRRTGGLADTIIDIDQNLSASNGISFDLPDAVHFTAAVVRAMGLYRRQEAWEALMARGMMQDFSWNFPGNEYIALYQQLL